MRRARRRAVLATLLLGLFACQVQPEPVRVGPAAVRTLPRAGAARQLEADDVHPVRDPLSRATPAPAAPSPPAERTAIEAPPAPAARPQVSRTLPVPVIAQAYNLSCEAAGIQMLAAYEGVATSQDAILAAMGVDARPAVVAGGRVTQWGDAWTTFVGSPAGHEYDTTGYGIYAPGAARAAAAVGVRVIGSGTVAPRALYDGVLAGHPAAVWIPFDGSRFAIAGPFYSYTAFDGARVPYAPGFEHVVVVAGVTDSAVLLINPRWGYTVWMDKATFEPLYAFFGDMAVVAN